MKRPILFVILQTGSLANGGLRSVSEIMTRLQNHQPIVLTNRDGEMTESWRDHGIKVHVVPEDASRHAFRHKPRAVLDSYRRYYTAVRQLIRANAVALVQANDPLAFQMSLAAAKLRGVRIALNLRGTMDPERRPPSLKYRAIFAAADHVFYLSEEMAAWWRQVASNATRASSVTYSIADPARFSPAPFPSDQPAAVLVSGIFSPGKGQLEFIRNIVPSLAAANVQTWFAGDFEPTADSYAAGCAAAAAPWSDHIRFLGYRADLPELLRKASVVAIPSRHEGLVRGMIEAMSCGRPVVSFDVCSAREILEAKAAGAGSVVRMGDFEAMASALIHYATDERARAAAGEAASEAARTLFTPDRVVDRYERVYRELGAR
jgi:glycosyltransferase involved in cell wall biosynthesis